MDSPLGILKPLVGALLMPLPVFLGLALLGLVWLAGGRRRLRRLADWLPSANNLRKTELAIHEYLGLLAWRWDHPG